MEKVCKPIFFVSLAICCLFAYIGDFATRNKKSPKQCFGLFSKTLLITDWRCAFCAYYCLYSFILPTVHTRELGYVKQVITCLGLLRAQIGTLQHLLEMRPYLLYLLPTVQDILHRSSGGSLERQPCVAFRRCYGLVVDR